MGSVAVGVEEEVVTQSADRKRTLLLSGCCSRWIDAGEFEKVRCSETTGEEEAALV